MDIKKMTIGELQEQLKELLEKLRFAEEQEEKTYSAFKISAFENEELGKDWSDKYEAKLAANEELVDWIVNKGGEKLAKEIVRAIIRKHRKMLEAFAEF